MGEDEVGDEAESPGVEEKVRQIVKEYPSWGPGKIAKELNTERYEFVRMGTIAVWKLLRKLNLGTKKQREDFKEDEETTE